MEPNIVSYKPYTEMQAAYEGVWRAWSYLTKFEGYPFSDSPRTTFHCMEILTHLNYWQESLEAWLTYFTPETFTAADVLCEYYNFGRRMEFT